jgi:hypothetical protein
VRALALLLALLPLLAAGLAAAQQGGGVTAVTLSVFPDSSCGSIVVLSGASPGAVSQYPYTFTAPQGTTLTLSAQPAPGFRLSKWIVNGTEYSAGVLQVTVSGSSLSITAVFTLNMTVTVVKTPVGTVYVSTTGFTWVEPSPLRLDVLPVRQAVNAYVNISSISWRQAAAGDALNLSSRAVYAPSATYELVLVNRCLETCYPVTFYAYDLDGNLRLQQTLQNATYTAPWGSDRAVVYVQVNGQVYGPFLAAAPAPASPVPDWLAPLFFLLPLGLFVALGVRASARDAALGMLAYAVLAPTLLALIGLPRTAIPVAGTIATVAVILLLVDRYARQ